MMGAFLAVISLGVGLIVLLAFRNGKAVERAHKEEEINNAVNKALLVRDRLRHDSGFASRVRKRFTR